jgi:hypothetical protein
MEEDCAPMPLERGSAVIGQQAVDTGSFLGISFCDQGNLVRESPSTDSRSHPIVTTAADTNIGQAARIVFLRLYRARVRLSSERCPRFVQVKGEDRVHTYRFHARDGDFTGVYGDNYCCRLDDRLVCSSRE